MWRFSHSHSRDKATAIAHLARHERGAAIPEYVMLFSLLALIALPAGASLGRNSRNSFQRVGQPATQGIPGTGEQNAGQTFFWGGGGGVAGASYGFGSNGSNQYSSGNASGPGGSAAFSGGGTESNIPGGVEKARGTPAERNFTR